MYQILERDQLSNNVVKLVIEAREIARSRKPGQFVIIRIGDKGERIPLTIADADSQRGSITLIIQKVGTTSHRLFSLKQGESLTDLVGPLGKPTNIEKVGTVIAAGGGVGIAPLYPIARALKEAGNRLITILAARNRDLIILEDEMKSFSDEVHVWTDDGSQGRKGLVTEGIKRVVEKASVDQVVAIGPAVMMKFVALLTKEYNIQTLASLNTIMVDGTGMCGACRITVGGKTKFVCVDGPEFDAHQVDFEEMLMRLNAYQAEENISYTRFTEGLK